MADEERYRPAEEGRWHKDRTEPVRIDVRTEWLYSDGHRAEQCVCCPGRHAFSRAGNVVRSDVPPQYEGVGGDLSGHLFRALQEFGDDRDLVIEVRPR